MKFSEWTKWVMVFSSVTYVPVHAQSVTLYGVVDSGIQVGKSGGNTVTRVETGPVTPSRWGMTGSEDLGDGLSAVFKLEDGFNINNGTISGNGALFNREAWVGLRGHFGQIQIGNNYTPLFLTYVTYSLGELNTLAWGNATNNFTYVPVARTANSVRYQSPDFFGLTGRALYARGANGASNVPGSLGDTASLGLAFKNGGLALDFDYLQQRFSSVSAAALSSTSPVATGRYYLFGASYDFGLFKPAFLYQSHRNAGGVGASSTTTYANPDQDFYEANVLIHVPRYVGGLLLSFGQYRLKGNSAGNALSYAVRYDYLLSKSTGVYAGIGYVKNNHGASFTMNDASTPGIPIVAGKSLVSSVFGIVHKF
jgi:predicted porin